MTVIMTISRRDIEVVVDQDLKIIASIMTSIIRIIHKKIIKIK